ncbi:metal-binding protein [Synechocystis salina LEGE 06099]|uniref:metal-binding protein n=1 Tax=Synechocystis salina TaxID=945780 RepID=UPI00187F6BC7|nr:metal-binding protein [Synechocystis salina]MBE9204506.1 metal-binding protein [Synechocystis salina LEGE 06099]
MPAGKIHDRITLGAIPAVIAIAFISTGSVRLTLLMAIAFGFSGLMFGPDLDIHSCQYKRWGWLRWIWLPYRRFIPHRSPLSHGFLIGTILRLLYLGGWLLLGALGMGIVLVLSQKLNLDGPESIDWSILGQWLQNHRWELLTTFVGLEAGAMAHSVSDWGGSWLKKKLKPQQKKHPSQGKSKSRRRS